MSESARVLESVHPPGVRTGRVIGRYGAGKNGPKLVTIGGMHGNEPSGITASQNVLQQLMDKQVAFRGEWIALGGNLAALEVGARFLQEDLNRVWTPERVEEIRKEDPARLEFERKEQAELLDSLELLLPADPGNVIVIDLHTTSADGAPFAVVEDTLRNRRFAFRFPVPVILGFEEQVGGALSEWITDRGAVCISFEGGQHDSSEAVANHESLLWLAFRAAGLLDNRQAYGLSRHRQRLRDACRNVPGAFEIQYRHGIKASDGFRMRAGFRNFDVVETGQVLAGDINGPVAAPKSGKLIMPLYQKQGDDGFFVAREFRIIWLRVSKLMRRLRFDRIAHLLPGVEAHPRNHGWLIVNPGIARWFAVEIFHLLGFRRHTPEGAALVFSRRRHDL